jgi:hypothetical protein
MRSNFCLNRIKIRKTIHGGLRAFTTLLTLLIIAEVTNVLVIPMVTLAAMCPWLPRTQYKFKGFYDGFGPNHGILLDLCKV